MPWSPSSSGPGLLAPPEGYIGSRGAVDVVRLLHLLAMAFLVGGQIFLLVAVVPVLRGSGDRAQLRAVARRFGYGTVVAIAVLAATGMTLATRLDRWDTGLLNVKLALVGAAAGLVLWHMRRQEAEPTALSRVVRRVA